MFCSKCGCSVADGAQFCSKCGNNIAVSVGGGAAVAPARIPEHPKAGRTSYIVWLLAVLAVFGTIVMIMVQGYDQWARSVRIVPNHPAVAQLHRTTFDGGALTVAQNRYSAYKMIVPPDATDVQIQGHFKATGGMGNDIIVSVMNEDEFINWQNGHGDDTLWESDKVTADDIKLSLPKGGGVYYLLFDNRFSLLSPKAVAQDIALTYLSRN